MNRKHVISLLAYTIASFSLSLIVSHTTYPQNMVFAIALSVSATLLSIIVINDFLKQSDQHGYD